MTNHNISLRDESFVTCRLKLYPKMTLHTINKNCVINVSLQMVRKTFTPQ